jgi:Ca2+-binding EF-hand superfamily protein
MRGIKLLVGALAAVVLLAGCATPESQASRKDYESLCAALDKDRKGAISREDFVSGAKDKKQAEKLFQLCDTNQDQMLSFEEYQKQQRLIHNIFELPPPPQAGPPVR